MNGRDGGRRSGELAVPFLFVPHGAEPPTDWLAAHPGAVRFPGKLVPRDGSRVGMGASGTAAKLSQNAASILDPEKAASAYQMASPRPTPASLDAAPPPPVSGARKPALTGSGAVTRQTIRAGTGTAPQPPPAPSDYAARLAAATAVERAGRYATPADMALVAAHLANSLSLAELQRVKKDGLAIRVTEEDIGHTTRKYDQTQARNYPYKKSSATLPGLYNAEDHEVMIATQPDVGGKRRMPGLRENGSVDTVLHELAHGLNRAEGRNGVLLSDSNEFTAAYNADATEKPFDDKYYHSKTGQPPGADGRDEAFAESFAMFKHQPRLMKQQLPHLYDFMSRFVQGKV